MSAIAGADRAPAATVAALPLNGTSRRRVRLRKPAIEAPRGQNFGRARCLHLGHTTYPKNLRGGCWKIFPLLRVSGPDRFTLSRQNAKIAAVCIGTNFLVAQCERKLDAQLNLSQGTLMSARSVVALKWPGVISSLSGQSLKRLRVIST